jgi:hypothetical protein
MGFFQDLFRGAFERNLQFADFTSDDIQNLNLLDNAEFLSFSNWTGKEGEFRTAPTGFNHGRYASLNGTSGDLPVSFFIGEQRKTRKRGERQEVYFVYSFFMDVEIPFHTPHVIVTANTDTALTRLSAFNGASVDFGKFNDFYSVLATKEHEAKTFEMFPPDTLLKIIETIPDVSFEYRKNVIRFSFKVGHVNQELTEGALMDITQDEFMHQFKSILSVLPELTDSAKTGEIQPEEFVKLKGVANPLIFFVIILMSVMLGIGALVSNNIISIDSAVPVVGVLFGGFFLSAIFAGFRSGNRRRKLRKQGFTKEPPK